MTPPKAVICDFGGVLTSPLIEAFAAYQDRSGVAMEDLGRALQSSANRHGEHPLFELEKGRISEREFLRRIEVELAGEVRLTGFTEIYFEHLRPNSRMIEWTASLRPRGVRTALLTNNVREWEPLWRAKLPELDDIFEVVVDSAFVGMRKPEPEIYGLTLERMGDGIEPSDCVFVDDLEPNCQTARELGMTAVVFRDAEQAIAEAEAALAKV